MKIIVEDDFEYSALGILSYEGMIKMKKKNQQSLVPRSDGKELCKKLKKARNELAEANGIDFHSEDCPVNGACGGTCPKCDEELRYLMTELDKIPEDKRIYPKLEIEEKYGCKLYTRTQDADHAKEEVLPGMRVPIASVNNTNSLTKMGAIKIPDYLKRDKNE